MTVRAQDTILILKFEHIDRILQRVLTTDTEMLPVIGIFVYGQSTPQQDLNVVNATLCYAT